MSDTLPLPTEKLKNKLSIDKKIQMLLALEKKLFKKGTCFF